MICKQQQNIYTFGHILRPHPYCKLNLYILNQNNYYHPKNLAILL